MSTPVVVPQYPRTLDVLREQLAPEANDAELAYLDQVAQRFDLDPVAGQIVLRPQFDRRVGRKVHRPFITHEGRLVLAERTGEFRGIDGPYWTGLRLEDGTHRWVDVWDGTDPPHAARAFVAREGRLPSNGTVRWAEFAQRDRNGDLMPTWRAMPSHMLGKVAISLGLRRAFPGIIPADLEVDAADLDIDDADTRDTPPPGEAVSAPPVT